MRPALMHRDLDDVMSDLAHNTRVVDVQRTHTAPLAKPASWDTAVIFNDHDTKIVLRQHRHTGAVRLKVTPAKTVDLVQPETYELELMPDFPFHVLTNLLEILK